MDALTLILGGQEVRQFGFKGITGVRIPSVKAGIFNNVPIRNYLEAP